MVIYSKNQKEKGVAEDLRIRVQKDLEENILIEPTP